MHPCGDPQRRKGSEGFLLTKRHTLRFRQCAIFLSLLCIVFLLSRKKRSPVHSILILFLSVNMTRGSQSFSVQLAQALFANFPLREIDLVSPRLRNTTSKSFSCSVLPLIFSTPMPVRPVLGCWMSIHIMHWYIHPQIHIHPSIN